MKKINSFVFVVLLLVGSAFASSIEIPFTYQKHVAYVEVYSPKQHEPLRFILDTGASPTAVETITAGHLKVREINNPDPASGTNLTFGLGNSPGFNIRGLHATCGGMPLRKTAIATDLINLSLVNGLWIDGLLGTDFFRDKILTIDFVKHSLLVEQAPGTDCAWTRLLDDIPFSGRHDTVFVNVNTPRGPLVFLLDTGSTQSAIDMAVVKSLHLQTGAARNVNVVGGKKAVLTVTHFEGTLDGYPLPSAMVGIDLDRISKGISHHIDGIVGMDFLEKHKVRIDFHTRQVLLDDGIHRSIAAR